jgi:hypothetical protein
MNRLRLTFCASLFATVTLAFTSLAHAQATRTWVSGVGDDANPCSRTAPCKTFAGAISKTALGGEISVLDPGGFGTVTITKSITVDGTGNLAGILANAVTGITINITDPKDKAKSVRLRGLSINGVGTGVHGINVMAANNVVVEDTVIDGFVTTGINVREGAVFVKNTSIRNNPGTGVNVATRGQLGLTDVSLVFNDTALAGTFTSMTWFNNVVLYGNRTGDSKPPGVK